MVSKIPQSFGAYLKERSSLKLIDDWTQSDLAAIKRPLKALAELIRGQVVPSGKSNQAIGNSFQNLVTQALLDSRVSDLNFLIQKGQGYPDVALWSKRLSSVICMEIKSTSKWSNSDGNRRVLMSSVNRLEGLRRANPGKRLLHFVCSVHYDATTLTAVRLQFHFIDSKSPVSYREEISTSQKSLASGDFKEYSP